MRSLSELIGSLLSLLRIHWDHEPTPNPSQAGNGQDPDECLLPSWEGSGVGRFMESGTAWAAYPLSGRVKYPELAWTAGLE